MRNRRSLDLRLIDESRRMSLEKQLTGRGWRKSEPVSVNEEDPLLIRRFIEAATGQSSVPKIANVVGYPTMITREIVA